jgi:hypothetical protein
MLKAKTRIEDTMDIAKNVHDKTQELSDATVATVYTDRSGIDKKIGWIRRQILTKEVETNMRNKNIRHMSYVVARRRQRLHAREIDQLIDW